MSILSIRAVSYEAMADFLRGQNPLSRCALDASAHDRVWIISVSNSPTCPLNVFEGWEGDPAPLVSDSEDRIALVFDDIDARGEDADARAREKGHVFFDDAMAQKVCAFIDRAHRDDPQRGDLLLVNCHAGVSRSGAIADFARAALGLDYDAFRHANAQIVPNVHVRKLLLNAWKEIS